VTSFFGIKVAFLRFSQKRKDESAPNFFSGFRRKHYLFVTTLKKQCIEKQFTQPLSILAKELCYGSMLELSFHSNAMRSFVCTPFVRL